MTSCSILHTSVRPSVRPSIRIKKVSTRTVDTTGAGGDAHVSSLLFFSLVYYSQATGEAEETAVVYANPAGGDCLVVADALEVAIEDLASFEGTDGVTVSAAVDGLEDESCVWRVTFDGASGNVDQLAVKVQGGGNTGGAAVGFHGDDAVAVRTLRDGTVDAIKYELEKLSTVGVVTVTPHNYSSSKPLGLNPAGGCTWRVTFETNTGAAADGGKLTPLTVAVPMGNGSASDFAQFAYGFPARSDAVAICNDTALCIDGTSTSLGGQFTVGFRGQRSLYMPNDVSARGLKTGLEAMPTVGRVDVARRGPDENFGFTWSVTFLTELGDVPPLDVDDAALTGTVPTGRSSEQLRGIFPPFDSLDPAVSFFHHGLFLCKYLIDHHIFCCILTCSCRTALPWAARHSHLWTTLA